MVNMYKRLSMPACLWRQGVLTSLSTLCAASKENLRWRRNEDSKARMAGSRKVRESIGCFGEFCSTVIFGQADGSSGVNIVTACTAESTATIPAWISSGEDSLYPPKIPFSELV